MKKIIDLAVGGESWDGFTFGPWGKSREWFLFTPDGARYAASELRALRDLTHDLDYLQTRVRELERLLGPGAVAFAAAEAAILRRAASLIERAIPRENTRARAAVVTLAR